MMEGGEENVTVTETPLHTSSVSSPLETYGVHGLCSSAGGEEIQSPSNESNPRNELNNEEEEEEEEEEKYEKDEEGDSLDELIENGLYQLGITADGTSQVYLNLSIKGKNLEHLDFVKRYGHLQVLDISENHLTDLSALKFLPYLISLNASHNQLTSIINFNPPIGLREVNFSYNQIEEIGDLSMHPLLNTLLLDNNHIEEIAGINQCYALSNISVSHNKLTKISGLDGLPVKQLDVSNNYIRKVENLQTLKDLQYINLGYNQLRSLRGLQQHELLEDINLRYNQVIDISEIRYLRGLKLLRILNLDGNPIQEITDYRLSILFRIPALMELDVAPVSCEEKVAAMNLFKPSLELIATGDHMENLLKSYLNPTLLLNSTLSISDPFPMLVLIGPMGMGKKLLAHNLTEQFPNCFGVAVGHTTRSPATKLLNGKVKAEADGETYHFIDKHKFEEMKTKGDFLQTCTLYGSSYGMSAQSIEAVAQQNLACIITMELEGIMTLKKTHFKPRCILVLPQDVHVYKDNLQNTNKYTESEIFESTHKVALYTEIHQVHPGYFDATIVTDSFDERSKQLRNTVKSYLDITPPNSVESTLVESRENNTSKTTPLFRMTSMDNASRPLSVPLNDSRRGKSAAAAVSVSTSYQRRYDKTRAALMGVTSTFQEQLEKIKKPLSSPVIPFVRGYKDLLKGCIATELDNSSSSNDDIALDGEITSTSELITADTTLRYTDFDDMELE